MDRLGLDMAVSKTAETLDEARTIAKELIGGFPIIIRPAFTLGGTGGGVAYNQDEFERIVRQGLDASMTSQARVTESATFALADAGAYETAQRHKGALHAHPQALNASRQRCTLTACNSKDTKCSRATSQRAASGQFVKMSEAYTAHGCRCSWSSRCSAGRSTSSR